MNRPADPSPSAGGVRARVRAELTAEIKRLAREQLRTEGASSLSLRAIARELDMASSAIYRYFASRDELLTALIVDAFNAVGERVEAADAAIERSEVLARFVAIAHAIRDWAMEQPHEYALVYGSPVPGYAAPQDTIDPAVRVPLALLELLIDRYGAAPAAQGGDPTPELDAALADLADFVNDQLPAHRLVSGVAAWGEILGLISLELFGHLKNAVNQPQVVFQAAVGATGRRILEVNTYNESGTLP